MLPPLPEEASLLDIQREAGRFVHDPLGYVYWCFPWGTPELPDEGPDEWQQETLATLGRELKRGGTLNLVQLSVVAGNGVGKSALIAWLIKWAMETWEDTRGTVTANTALQLKTKTWAELHKWHNLSITRPLLDLQATSLISLDNPGAYRIDAVPWNKDKPEAIAGHHNKGKRSLLLFDEGSNIPDVIWEFTEAGGIDADTEIIWAAFGNPTRNSGRFRECWRKFSHRWVKPNRPPYITDGRVDGRTCRHTNKKKIQQWIEDWGDDHDFVRIRVKGEFPRVGDAQFFSSENIAAARIRQIDNSQLVVVPAVIGVDVAAGGSDSSVITCRRGPKLMWKKKLPYVDDTMKLAGLVIESIANERNMRAICVDANGVGKGVADRLSELYHQGHGLPPIVHVYGAMQASDPIRYRNLRTELFDRCRDWLKGAAIGDDVALVEQMEGIEQGFTPTMQLAVETKKDMKERLGYSPDDLDSLIYTFAEVVYSPNVQRRHAKRVVQPRRWR